MTVIKEDEIDWSTMSANFYITDSLTVQPINSSATLHEVRLLVQVGNVYSTEAEAQQEAKRRADIAWTEPNTTKGGLT